MFSAEQISFVAFPSKGSLKDVRKTRESKTVTS